MLTRKSQVWIETVIYTLIGLTVIGLLLTFAKPKIEEIRDKAVIEQTIEALTKFDSAMSDITVASGNKKFVFFTLKKGQLEIDAIQNKVMVTLKDSKYVYTEPNKNITYARLNIADLMIETEKNKTTNVMMWLDYNDRLDFTYDYQEQVKTFPSATTPYKIALYNKESIGGTSKVDISIA